MKNIIVGIDLHEGCDTLIDKAQELAKLYGAKVWLLHVVSPIPEAIGYDVAVNYISLGVDEAKEACLTQLKKYTNQIQSQGIEAEAVLLEGMATHSILEESKKLKVDLIICGHHEHSALYQLLFGSTVAAIVRSAEIPVLVYPLK